MDTGGVEVIQENAILTKRLLLGISKHLAGRPDCRNINYRVMISSIGDNVEIKMTPKISVFPNKYHRKSHNKIPVELHVLCDHITVDFDKDCISELVPGTYEYTSSFDNKRRKWIKIL